MQIILAQLSKTYHGNVQALRDINLTIPPGMYGLLGPNGAGKTTLMRILAGIIQPSAGQAMVGEHDIATDRGRQAVKRTLGYLPQELGLYPDLSAREFLDYIGLLKGLDRARQRQQRVRELLDLVGLAEVATRKLKTFSGGMKRRVGIAQALLNDPQLLIVDEPTAGLDPEERIRFRNLLVDLGGDRTVLLSTHIIEDIAQTCQHLAIMSHGQVRFQGTIADILHAAAGHVWLMTTPGGTKPTGEYTVVSTLPLGEHMQYRIVGNPPAGVATEPTPPTLEDGYIWLMQR